jgi:putative membrane protein
MMYWSGDWSWWAWLAMTLMMLSFWTIVGVSIWALVRHVGPTSAAPSGRTTTTAEEVLRQRYAAGELDDGEFQRRLEMLRENNVAKSNHG